MSARKPRICAWARGYGLTFSPRVRLIGRKHDAFFNETRIKCIVTGRDDAHRAHRYYAGDVTWARPSQLYRKWRVVTAAP